MGITIHYTVVVRDEHLVDEILSELMKTADELGLPYTVIDGEMRISPIEFVHDKYDEKGVEETMDYLREKFGVEPAILPADSLYRGEMPDLDTLCWIRVWEGGYSYGYWDKSRHGKVKVPAKGVIVRNSLGNSEDLNLIFLKIGGRWMANSFTKTQPFSPEEAEGNAKFHIFICAFLKSLEGRVDSLYVYDEAGFYETGEVENIKTSFSVNLALINLLAPTISKLDLGEVEVGSTLSDSGEETDGVLFTAKRVKGST